MADEAGSPAPEERPPKRDADEIEAETAAERLQTDEELCPSPDYERRWAEKVVEPAAEGVERSSRSGGSEEMSSRSKKDEDSSSAVARNDVDDESSSASDVDVTGANSSKEDDVSVEGIGEHVPLREALEADASGEDQRPWNRPFTADDLNLMHELRNLPFKELITEVKKLHDLAYQLGTEEAKEMTRGKYLNVFKSRKHR